MFPCIGCAKQTSDDHDERDEGSRRQSGTPLQRQDSARSITTQLKDMVLKFSGSSKQSSRSGPGSSSRGMGPIENPENTVAEGVQYPDMGGVGSASARAWELRTSLKIVSRSSVPFIVLGAADQTPPSGHESVVAAPDVAVEEEDDGRKWMAQVEQGVTINFESLPDGGNELKSIYLSPEIFTRLDASQWWFDNYDTVIDFYDVKKINQKVVPPKIEDQSEQEPGEPGDISFPIQSSETDSPVAEWLNNHVAPGHGIELGLEQHMNQHPSGGAAALDQEWIMQDSEGVFITIKANPDGTREVRRVRFSRQMFDDEEARRWWLENKERVYAQYL